MYELKQEMSLNKCPGTIWSLCEHSAQIMLQFMCAYHSSCGWQWSSSPILKLLKLDIQVNYTFNWKNDYFVTNNTTQRQPILTSHYILQVIACMLPFTCMWVWGYLKLCRILLFFPFFIVLANAKHQCPPCVSILAAN